MKTFREKSNIKLSTFQKFCLIVANVILSSLILQEFFSKWSRTFNEFNNFSEFKESDKSLNWPQFKYPASNMCLTGAVVALWSLTQELAGSSPLNDIFCH